MFAIVEAVSPAPSDRRWTERRREGDRRAPDAAAERAREPAARPVRAQVSPDPRSGWPTADFVTQVLASRAAPPVAARASARPQRPGLRAYAGAAENAHGAGQGGFERVL